MKTFENTPPNSLVNLQKRLHERGNEKICPVALLRKDGKILIGLRNYTADKWKEISVWTFPGGRCDTDETVEETLRRELDEETGIASIEINEFVGELPGAKEGDVVYIFTCITNSDPILREPEKFSEWRWVNIDDVPENFINPAVLDLVRKHINL